MPQSSSLGRKTRHSRAMWVAFCTFCLPCCQLLISGETFSLHRDGNQRHFSWLSQNSRQKRKRDCLCSGKSARPASAGLSHPSFRTHLHTFPFFQIGQVWMTAVTWCVSAGKITLAHGIFPLKKKQLFFLKELSLSTHQSLPVLTENSASLPLNYFLPPSLGSLNTDLCWSSACFWLNAQVFGSRSLSCYNTFQAYGQYMPRPTAHSTWVPAQQVQGEAFLSAFACPWKFQWMASPDTWRLKSGYQRQRLHSLPLSHNTACRKWPGWLQTSSTSFDWFPPVG